MENFEKIYFGLITGSTFPMVLSLLSAAVWYFLNKSVDAILIYLGIGFLLGLIIDLKFLKSWINNRYRLSVGFVGLIYILNNILILGFFMGVPVFNLMMGLIAGYYYGKRIQFENIPIEKLPYTINKVSLFTSAIMTLICISSGLIALIDQSTGANLKLMLGLNFEVTETMVKILVFVGGFILIVAQYFITKLAILKTLKSFN